MLANATVFRLKLKIISFQFYSHVNSIYVQMRAAPCGFTHRNTWRVATWESVKVASNAMCTADVQDLVIISSIYMYLLYLTIGWYNSTRLIVHYLPGVGVEAIQEKDVVELSMYQAWCKFPLLFNCNNVSFLNYKITKTGCLAQKKNQGSHSSSCLNCLAQDSSLNIKT